MFDKRKKLHDFKIGDKVLKWDSRREDKGKHGKFDSLWQGPYIIQSAIGPNALFLQEETIIFQSPSSSLQEKKNATSGFILNFF